METEREKKGASEATYLLCWLLWIPLLERVLHRLCRNCAGEKRGEKERIMGLEGHDWVRLERRVWTDREIHNRRWINR